MKQSEQFINEVAELIGRRRFNDGEISIINSVFSNNEPILYLLRKFFLQGELTEEENKLIRSVASEEVIGVLRKTIVPPLDHQAPFTQMKDFWATVPSDTKLEDFERQVSIYQLVYDYLSQRLKCLINGNEDERDIKFNDLVYSPDKELKKAQIELGARNTILARIDRDILQLKILAGFKPETPEQIKKRLKLDDTR